MVLSLNSRGIIHNRRQGRTNGGRQEGRRERQHNAKKESGAGVHPPRNIGMSGCHCEKAVCPVGSSKSSLKWLVYDFVFIAGTGRSRSTTLMTFLNSIDGVHISGENNSTVKHLHNRCMSHCGMHTDRN